jgi:hypothetical protein
VQHEDRSLATILDHPLNANTHPPEQSVAVERFTRALGWLTTVIVNERTGRLLNGHLRCAIARANGEATIPTTVVDLDEDEEAIILATFDLISKQALTDHDNYRELMELSTPHALPELADLLDDTAQAILDGPGVTPLAAETRELTKAKDAAVEASLDDTVNIGPYTIPLSRTECMALNERAAAYLDEHSILHGFARRAFDLQVNDA